MSPEAVYDILHRAGIVAVTVGITIAGYVLIRWALEQL